MDDKIGKVDELINKVPNENLDAAGKEVGKSLVTITQSINLALFPLRLAVWGYDQIEKWVSSRLEEKLKDVPPEKIVTPPIEIAGPTLQGLRFTSEESQIRELYVNLLASSMNSDTQSKTHPGYVEALKNMVSDEALIMKHFAETSAVAAIDIYIVGGGIKGMSPHYECYTHMHKKIKFSNEDLIPAYVTNLCRIGLLCFPHGLELNEQTRYTELTNDEDVVKLREELKPEGRKVNVVRKVITTTAYGKLFISSVIR